MQDTQPIRDTQTIEDIRQYLYDQNFRNGFLYDFLLNTGLRIGDALQLKVREVTAFELIIIEEKTSKRKVNIPLDPIRGEIDAHIRKMDPNEYLFPSNKGGAMSRIQAYRILDKAGKAFDINISPHTLRKTFGYHKYFQTKDIATLQTIFNHARPSITLKYIGITQDEVNTLFIGPKI
jgi:integrase